MRYKGKSVESQRIKAKKTPKIQVSENIDFLQEEIKNIPSPEFKVFKIGYVGEEKCYDGILHGIKSLRYELLMPILVKFIIQITGKALIFETNEKAFYVRAGNLYEICLKWPTLLDEKSLKVNFNCQTRTLHITINLKELIKEEKISKVDEKIKKPEEIKESKRDTLGLNNNLLNDIVYLIINQLNISGTEHTE